MRHDPARRFRLPWVPVLRRERSRRWERADLPTVGRGLLEPDRAPQPDTGTVSTRVILFDRRLGQRVMFVSRARLQWPGHDVACTTVNLSIRGVGCDLAPDVPTESLPATGSAVDVTLNLRGTLTVLQARVGWCRVEERGAAMGLQLVRLRETHEALLQGVVISGHRCEAREPGRAVSRALNACEARRLGPFPGELVAALFLTL